MSTVDEILGKHIAHLDPLPFENIQGNRPVPYLTPTRSETQDTWLGPSQPTNHNHPAVKLFYEPNKDTASPGAAASNPSGQHCLVFHPPQPQGRPVCSANIPSAQRRAPVIPPQPQELLRQITVEYLVFIKSANNLLSIPANPTNKPTGPPKEWEKVYTLADTVWTTAIANWNWQSFKTAMFRFLEKDREHLGVHMQTLEQSKVLKWKCILWGHRLYGNKGNYIVTQDTDFLPFLEAVKQSPTSKINIKITMEDPNKSARNIKQVCLSHWSFLG